jgi:hypothetical protein
MDTPEFAELRDRTKDVVAAEWWGFVQKAFRRTATLLDQTEDPVKSATAGAIIFDKMALSTGDATSRTESRNISDDIPASVKRELRRRYAAIDSGGDDVAREGAEGATSTTG